MYKIKHYLRRNENKGLYCKALRWETIKNNKKSCFPFFKLDFQKVDQHTGGTNSPVEYPGRECKHDIKESKGNIFNQIFKENV